MSTAQALFVERWGEAVDAYAGVYRTEAGVSIRIGACGEGAWAHIRGAPPIRLFYEGLGLFYTAGDGLTLKFAAPLRGVSGYFVLSQPGAAPVRAERVRG